MGAGASLAGWEAGCWDPLWAGSCAAAWGAGAWVAGIARASGRAVSGWVASVVVCFSSAAGDEPQATANRAISTSMDASTRPNQWPIGDFLDLMKVLLQLDISGQPSKYFSSRLSIFRSPPERESTPARGSCFYIVFIIHCQYVYRMCFGWIERNICENSNGLTDYGQYMA